MDGQQTPVVPQVDAYAGPEIARRALAAGEKKAALPFLPTLVLGILAGVFIAFGGNVFTIATTDSGLGFGVTRLLGGLVFCLGLILVVIAGAELFTGNALIIMAWLSHRVSTGRLLRNWGIVYLGNFVGSLAMVALVFAARQYAMDDYGVGAQMIKIAVAKIHLPWFACLASAVLCNALVCLAVWMCFSCRSTVDRIVAIVFPITAFIAGGFEHCVANMYMIPMGIVAALHPEVVTAAGGTVPADLTWTSFLLRNLIPATLGNIIGGALVVGAVYWVAYLLPDHAEDHRRLAEERARNDRPCAD